MLFHPILQCVPYSYCRGYLVTLLQQKAAEAWLMGKSYTAHYQTSTGQTPGGEADNPVQIHLAGNSQQFLGTARVFETQCKVF